LQLDPASFYGANGCMTQRVKVSSTRHMTYTPSWDAENRLSVVTNTATTPNAITRFIYDGDGARVQQVAIGGTQVTLATHRIAYSAVQA
jgi:YD repeat-containing protein